jgi:type VI secretion system protein ImpD
MPTLDLNSHNFLRILIAQIDQVLITQTLLIVKNKEFQNLLSAWSCIYYLTQCSDQKSTKTKILDVKSKELSYLINGSDEIDNIISHKILDEQEMPGNEPLSLLLTSYIFDATNPLKIAMLNQLAQTCAYAFTPFLVGVNSKIFDANDLTKLEFFSLKDIHTSNKFKALAKLAKEEYSNFLGLVMPEVYYPILKQSENHFLNTSIEKNRVILGSGAFALAAVIMKAFEETGWFLDMIGIPLQHKETPLPFGMVPNLELRTSNTLQTFHTQFAISETKEKELTDLGIIPLCQVKEQDILVIYSTQMLRNLHFKVSKETPTNKAHVLQPLLCVCRFAHYVRMIGRTRTGEFLNAQSFESHLEQWLSKYVASNPDVDRNLKRKYPLLGAKVFVSESFFSKYRYKCAIHLKPHLLSSEVSADIVLSTNLPAAK